MASKNRCYRLQNISFNANSLYIRKTNALYKQQKHLFKKVFFYLRLFAFSVTMACKVGLEPTYIRVQSAATLPVCPLADMAEGQGLEPQTVARDCFQDSVLVQPVTFHIIFGYFCTTPLLICPIMVIFCTYGGGRCTRNTWPSPRIT